MYILVIGSGAWGTTIANILADNRHDAVLWSRNPAFSKEIKRNLENKKYLSGIKLNPKIKFSSDFKCAEEKDVVFFAVPSQHMRDIAKEFLSHVQKNSVIVNLAKGIEIGTHKRMSQILEEIFPDNPVVSISGPNYSIEVAQKFPTATVAAGKKKEALHKIKEILSTDYFKVYPHSDLVGVEICGAVKNITAIASGIIAGKNYGFNSLASIITLGLTEMNSLGRFYGAKRSTVYGLAGVGDLVLTCTGNHSRNQFVGRELANGKSLAEINKILNGKIAEGIDTSKAVYEIIKENNLSMPLSEEIYKLLYRGKDIDSAIKDLLGNV